MQGHDHVALNQWAIFGPHAEIVFQALRQHGQACGVHGDGAGNVIQPGGVPLDAVQNGDHALAWCADRAAVLASQQAAVGGNGLTCVFNAGLHWQSVVGSQWMVWLLVRGGATFDARSIPIHHGIQQAHVAAVRNEVANVGMRQSIHVGKAGLMGGAYYNPDTQHSRIAVNYMVFSIAPDHPALDGHFPGHPVVPGVIIMEQVLRAAALAWPQCGVSGVHKWRFQQALLPDQSCEVVLGEPSANRVRFSCHHAGQTVCAGTLLLIDRPTVMNESAAMDKPITGASA